MANNFQLEQEFFKYSKVNFSKLLGFGFTKNKSTYTYSTNIINNTFKVVITINSHGLVNGHIYDLNFNDEYSNFRRETLGIYASRVKEAYLNILTNIKNTCFISSYFNYDQTNRLVNLIQEKYNCSPEFPWDNEPQFAVFKNPDTKKWYGLIMNINKNKLEPEANYEVEVINIKLAPSKIMELLTKPVFYPAYHMNKKNWLTIILDDTISDSEIMSLIEESYSFTVKKSNSKIKN